MRFTFENPSSDWIKISQLKLDFKDSEADERIQILSGDNIVAWAAAMRLKHKRDAHKTAALAGVLALIGAVAGTSSNRDVNSAGNLLMQASVVGLSAKAFNEHQEDIQSTEIYSSTHLLSGPISIPPGLHIKKWIVLNTSEPKQITVPGIQLHYKLHDDQRDSSYIPLPLFNDLTRKNKNRRIGRDSR